jgi:flagellar basal body-associated protein FliL
MNLIKDNSTHVVHADLSYLSNNEQQNMTQNEYHTPTIINKLINFTILKNNDIVVSHK